MKNSEKGDSEGKEESTFRQTMILLAMFLLFVVGVIGGAWIFIPQWYGGNIEAGTFGDMFGGVNALFSGLAFALLVVTLYLQMKELSLQRKELTDTRTELKLQRELMEKQNDAFSRQAFDSTFFRMLDLHNQIVNDMDVDINGVTKASGRDCFEFFSYAIEEESRKRQQKGASVFMTIYERHEANMGHYFRNLYQIVRFVDGSDIVDKQIYMSIVRAQLSSLELVILLYHCAIGNGLVDMKPLVEKYSLLKFLPKSKVSDASVTNCMLHEAYEEQVV
ncbi:MAG: putative phage abortive infection protein [bacterium]|nr:putative phage abortive infection protein [bacterium]